MGIAAMIGMVALGLPTAGRDGPAPALLLRLPEARRPARAALRIADRIVARCGDDLALTIIWPPTGGAGRVGRSSPTGAVDVNGPVDVVTRALQAEAVSAGDAVGVWLDAGGRVVLVEPFDEGAVHVAVDLAERGQVGRHWRPAVEAVRAALDARGVRVALEDALRVLDGRPEFAARAVEVAIGRAPSCAEDPEVQRFVDAASARSPRSEAVQRAAFVVWQAVGDVDAARSAAFAWLESVKGRPEAARALAHTLAEAGPAFEEVLGVAYDLAAAAAPDDVEVQRARFEFRFSIQGDELGADRAGRDLVAAIGSDAQVLNSFAWGLLTRSPYVGQLDRLALHAARAMRADPAWRTHWRLDTLALASFRNGYLEEAADLQREAATAADPSSRPRYLARLDQYESAAAAGVRGR